MLHGQGRLPASHVCGTHTNSTSSFFLLYVLQMCCWVLAAPGGYRWGRMLQNWLLSEKGAFTSPHSTHPVTADTSSNFDISVFHLWAKNTMFSYLVLNNAFKKILWGFERISLKRWQLQLIIHVEKQMFAGLVVVKEPGMEGSFPGGEGSGRGLWVPLRG